MSFCEICGQNNAQVHHIATRGRWGSRALVPENEIRLCFVHHQSFHDLGVDTAARIYGLEKRVEKAREAVKY